MSRPMLLGAALLLLGACAPETPLVDVTGDCADVFSGKLCTFASTQGDSLVAVGADVPLASIELAPAEQPMAWPPVANATLGLPEQGQAGSGFKGFTFYWEVGGHPPGPFLTPHFDFHFYLVPDAERLAIDCRDPSKPAVLPAGYVLVDLPLPPEMAAMTGVDTLVGTCVPQMGMHGLRAAELEGTEPWRGGMVIGYYAGRPLFIEPMITKAMLMEKKSFDLAIPEIPGVVGPYPRSFRATWNEEQQSYRFAFSGFAAGS